MSVHIFCQSHAKGLYHQCFLSIFIHVLFKVKYHNIFYKKMTHPHVDSRFEFWLPSQNQLLASGCSKSILDVVVYFYCETDNSNLWNFTDEERRVRDEKDKIQEIKDQLRDKTLRANELEVTLCLDTDNVFFKTEYKLAILLIIEF